MQAIIQALQPLHFAIAAIAAVALLVSLLTGHFRRLQKLTILKFETLNESNNQLKTEFALTQQRLQQSEHLNQQLKLALEAERTRLRESQQLLNESEKANLKLKGDLQKEHELST